MHIKTHHFKFDFLANRTLNEIGKKRKETVEWPSGNIKQNLGLGEFLTQGLKNVKIEYNLTCIVQNLTVVCGKMGEKYGCFVSDMTFEYMNYNGKLN